MAIELVVTPAKDEEPVQKRFRREAGKIITEQVANPQPDLQSKTTNLKPETSNLNFES